MIRDYSIHIEPSEINVREDGAWKDKLMMMMMMMGSFNQAMTVRTLKLLSHITLHAQIPNTMLNVYTRAYGRPLFPGNRFNWQGSVRFPLKPLTMTRFDTMLNKLTRCSLLTIVSGGGEVGNRKRRTTWYERGS